MSLDHKTFQADLQEAIASVMQKHGVSSKFYLNRWEITSQSTWYPAYELKIEGHTYAPLEPVLDPGRDSAKFSLPSHEGHEIVENVAGGKTFKYCRNCKEEVL